MNMESLRTMLEKAKRWLDGRKKRKALVAGINKLVKHLGLKVMDAASGDGHVYFLGDLQNGYPARFLNAEKTGGSIWYFITLESLLEHLFSYAGFIGIDSMWQPVENIYYRCSSLDEALVKQDLHISRKG